MAVIPGPKQPSINDFHRYSRVLVEELNSLYTGFEIRLSDETSITVAAALIGISCDHPAHCKLFGVPDWMGQYACPWCYMKFPRLPNTRNKPNFRLPPDTQLPPRENATRIEATRELLRPENSFEETVARFGSRLCPLLELHQFHDVDLALSLTDIGGLGPVDPMHCIDHGIVGAVFKVRCSFTMGSAFRLT